MKQPPADICREAMDIGGPALVFAAAKSNRVGVVMDPADYPRVAKALQGGKKLPENLRRELILKAVLNTAAYQVAIANWHVDQAKAQYPEVLLLSLTRARKPRYGENPHQSAALYRWLSKLEGANTRKLVLT